MTEDSVTVKRLRSGDLGLLLNADTSVFDNPIDPHLAKAYLAHPDYRITLAVDGDKVVGMATGSFISTPTSPSNFS